MSILPEITEHRDGPGPMLAGSTMPKGVPPRNPKAEKLAKSLLEAYRPQSLHDLKSALHDILGQAVNGLMDAELDAYLDSENESRAPGEKYNRRNGHTGKTVRTSDGPLRIRVPRDRDSTFQPEIVPKHSRDISDLESKIIPMYARGMSQRDIADTLEELYGCRVSHETVSQITGRVTEDVVKWQNRPLKPFYAFVFVDCIYASVRSGHGEKASQQAVYAMLGIDIDGHKDILGLSVNPSESKSHWMNLFDSLKQRGVKDILFLSMDGVTGLEDGVRSIFPETVVQRCIVSAHGGAVIRTIRLGEPAGWACGVAEAWCQPSLQLS